MYSCDELASTTGFLDLGNSLLGEELGLDDHRNLGHGSFAENLEVSGFGDINNKGRVLLGSSLSLDFLGNETPELVGVDGGAVIPVSLPLELSNTALTVEARMVFVHVDSLVMHTTGKTTSTRRSSVLSNSTVTHSSVTSLMSSLS